MGEMGKQETVNSREHRSMLHKSISQNQIAVLPALYRQLTPSLAYCSLSLHSWQEGKGDGLRGTWGP
jgi:hypothetical protein